MSAKPLAETQINDGKTPANNFTQELLYVAKLLIKIFLHVISSILWHLCIKLKVPVILIGKHIEITTISLAASKMYPEQRLMNRVEFYNSGGLNLIDAMG